MVREKLLAAQLFLLIGGTLAHAEIQNTPQRPHTTGAVQVKFKSSRLSASKRAALHKKSGTELVYRARHLPYDVVKLRKERKTSAESLLALCRAYQQFKEVAGCQVDWAPVPNADQAECPPENPTGLTIREIESTAKSVSALNPGNQKCELVDDHGEDRLMNGKLSAFWGYDFIGVDLARRTMQGEAQKLVPAKIGTWEDVNLSDLPNEALSSGLRTQRDGQKLGEDKGNFYHGTAVAGIIAGPSPYGIASKPLFVTVGGHQYYEGQGKELKAVDQALDKGVKIFQASTTSSNPDVFRKFTQSGVVTVRSAGNYFPEPEYYQAAPEESIMVGQLSAIGGMDGTSSSYPEVTIAAPGKVYSRFDGKGTLFGGTSGAQPVVSGCLANVVSLLPDVTPAEAKTLVVKTAIPTLNSQRDPRHDGAGTINCLKLVEVAKRLKTGWPQSRSQISAASLYDFASDAKVWMDAALKINPAGEACLQREKLDLLRRSFLLQPENKKTRDEIIAIYKASGLNGNAVIYESMNGFSDQRMIELSSTVQGSDFDMDLIRLAGERGGPLAVLTKGLSAQDEQAVMLAALYSKGKVEAGQVRSSLVRVFSEGKIGGYTFSTFFRVYFDHYQLPAKELLTVCGKKMPEWAKEQYPQSFPVCLMAMDRDPAEAKGFLVGQIRGGPVEFRQKLLDSYSWQKPPAYVIEVLRQERNGPWTDAQRAKIDELLKG